MPPISALISILGELIRVIFLHMSSTKRPRSKYQHARGGGRHVFFQGTYEVHWLEYRTTSWLLDEQTLHYCLVLVKL